jgi:hypothetical protein
MKCAFNKEGMYGLEEVIERFRIIISGGSADINELKIILKGLEKTLNIQQNKELKGHWRVLKIFLNTREKEKISVALDTDGKMLADKLLKYTAQDVKPIFQKL